MTKRALTLALIFAFGAVACGEPEPDPKDDTAPPDTTPDDTGPDTEWVDEDGDGYLSNVDCDDNDYRVHPDADELCDEIDNDCDEEIDEDFDADGDGHYSESQCDYGDDCDDGDAASYPGADEVPYDGVDQDCDGDDVTDVDGDGFIAEEAGGNDCDDENADVFPGNKEIPFDGIDNDCQDGDSADADGDGYNDADYGGDDCDDSDPTINPDGFEWWNDGVDQDCDGSDIGSYLNLADAGITIDGDSGFSTLVGHGIDSCDFDEDGLDDLVVAAPFYGYNASSGYYYYYGAVGIFYGNGAGLWTGGMAIDDADTLVEGSSQYEFLGFAPKCGDVNGDGHDDLVMSRGELYYADAGIDQAFAVLIYYGDGTGFDPALEDGDADAELTLTFGTDDQSGGKSVSVYSTELAIGDLDGDGAEEIIVDWGYGNGYDTSSVLLLPGGQYTGDLDLDEQVLNYVSTSLYGDLTYLRVFEDLDGDGLLDLFAGEPYYSLTVDTGDWLTDDDDSSREGMGAFLSDLSTLEGETLLESAYATILGVDELGYFGFDAVGADLDGDGATDGIFGAIGDSTDGDEAGAFYAFSDLASYLGSVQTGSPADADAHVYGSFDEGLLGYEFARAGDINGDGYEELLVSEPNGGTFDVGRVYLVNGELVSGEAAIEDVCLMGFEGDDSDNYIGSSLLGDADFDGDGLPDLVISALGWDDADDASYSAGQVLIYLSSDWGD